MSQQARLNNVISDWHPLPEGIRHYDSEGDPDRILSYITTLRMEMVCPIERRFNGDTDRGCQPERMSLSLRDSLKKTTDIRVLKCHQEFLLCRTPSDISPKTTLGYCTVTLHTCSNHSFSCQQGQTGGESKYHIQPKILRSPWHRNPSRSCNSLASDRYNIWHPTPRPFNYDLRPIWGIRCKC